jgi:two-component system, chemotaxis family, sensor kinase Cph1
LARYRAGRAYCRLARKETVRGQCAVWAPVELRAAADLAGDLAVLIAAGEISRLNQRLERLRGAIAALAIRDFGGVTASFGVVVHQEGELSRDMIKRADQAMYAAKDGGRNRVETSAG